MTKLLDKLQTENVQLKSALAAATSELDLHARYTKLVIKHWQDLTGCELYTPTIVEAIKHALDEAAKAEALQEEVDELNEKIDEVNVANEWLSQRLGNYE